MLRVTADNITDNIADNTARRSAVRNNRIDVSLGYSVGFLLLFLLISSFIRVLVFVIRRFLGADFMRRKYKVLPFNLQLHFSTFYSNNRIRDKLITDIVQFSSNVYNIT